MTSIKGLKIIIYMTLLATCLSCIAAEPKTDEDDKKTGRDDPFASLTLKQEPIQLLMPQDVNGSKQIKETKPDLFVETIALKFLDAKSLSTVIESMSSAYGSISIDEKANALIVCDSREILDRIIEEVNKADKTPEQNMFAETATLKFLEAKVLKTALVGMSSKYGSIEADENTNSLIVCDTQDNLRKILTEISKADRTPEQIMVEVVIADVKLIDETEIGVNWDVFHASNFKQTLTSTLDMVGTLGADFKLFEHNIGMTLHALREKRDIEILASPRVLVVSGQEALIETVEEVPYIEVSGTSEGGQDALSSTKFKNIGITLTVKATLADDNKIIMTISPEQTVDTGDVGGFQGNVPIVDRRTASTTLIMEDGQVVVMGGLRRKEHKLTSKGVPFFGSLPLVGPLFRYDKTEIVNSELVVLISPHIYKDTMLTDTELAKFNTLKNAPNLKTSENNIMEFDILQDFLEDDSTDAASN
jgi:type II secretory pathway component GspD/PulD (secretin)